MHLVDATLFYPARTGGVRTYLLAKSRWIRDHTPMRHTIVAPAAGLRFDVDAGVVGIPIFSIPFSHGFRWPLSSALATRCLRAA